MQNMVKMCVVMVLVLTVAAVAAGPVGQSKSGSEWQAAVISGYFSGGTLDKVALAGGGSAKLKADGGWLAGVKVGQDSEYLGWEATVAQVWAGADVDTTLFAANATADQADMLLVNLAGMVYPFGDSLNYGRIRPFFCGGPGYAYLDTDFDQTGSADMLEFFVGGGVKFLMGRDGNPVLRLDYRWHYLMGSNAGLSDNFYRHELSLGLGIRF